MQMMQVMDMELARVVALPRDTRLLEAAQSMVRTGATAVVIGSGAAILTERDLVAATALGRSPLTSAMVAVSSDCETVVASTTAFDALAAMLRSQATQLIVVDAAGDPIGTVSLAEVLTAVDGGGCVSGEVAVAAGRPATQELEPQP